MFAFHSSGLAMLWLGLKQFPVCKDLIFRVQVVSAVVHPPPTLMVVVLEETVAPVPGRPKDPVPKHLDTHLKAPQGRKATHDGPNA